MQAQFDNSDKRINTLEKEMENAEEKITLQEDNLKNLNDKIPITGKHILLFFFIKNDYETLSVIIPLQTQFGGILVQTVRLSVPRYDMILSTHVLRNGCMDFSEKLYIRYLPSEDVHLEF